MPDERCRTTVPHYGLIGRLAEWERRRALPDVGREAATVAVAQPTPGARVRALRLFAKLQQYDVRRVLGGPQDRASDIERGRREPTDDEYARLAELFRVPEALLRFGREHDAQIGADLGPSVIDAERR